MSLTNRITGTFHEVRLADDILDRIDQIVPPGTDIGLNEANYNPPTVATPDPRRRILADRTAA